jgi:hypothetical protein
MVKFCLLLVALVAGHSAVAAPQSVTPAAGDKYQAWRSAAEAALIARADANSLATAAALRYAGSANAKTGTPGSQPSALELAARASELAPESASIEWLHLQLCWATPSCDIRDVATVLRWVDADNGAAWLQTLAAAEKAIRRKSKESWRTWHAACALIFIGTASWCSWSMRSMRPATSCRAASSPRMPRGCVP